MTGGDGCGFANTTFRWPIRSIRRMTYTVSCFVFVRWCGPDQGRKENDVLTPDITPSTATSVTGRLVTDPGQSNALSRQRKRFRQLVISDLAESQDGPTLALGVLAILGAAGIILRDSQAEQLLPVAAISSCLDRYFSLGPADESLGPLTSTPISLFVILCTAVYLIEAIDHFAESPTEPLRESRQGARRKLRFRQRSACAEHSDCVGHLLVGVAIYAIRLSVRASSVDNRHRQGLAASTDPLRTSRSGC